MAKNLNYKYCFDGRLIEGELDYMAMFFDGHIEIGEVKCSKNKISKAREQLLRARDVFQNYSPRTEIYIVNDKRLYIE